MKIVINLLDGFTSLINSSRNDKVIDIKNYICKEIGKDLDELTLLYQGIVLNDDNKMINEYSFENNASISLIRRLRAGTKIFVRTKDKIISFEVIRSDKVIDIKNKVKEKLAIEVSHQRLIFADKTLTDDMVIENCGILDESVITLVVWQQDEIQVMVNTIDKRSTAFIFNRNDTIIRIKEKIQEKLGYHPEEQKIVFHGGAPDDNATVDSCNIENNCVLMLVIKLRNEIKVKVITMDKQTAILTLNRNDKIKVVKEKIQEKLTIHPDDQRIILYGVNLQDDATVDSYNMDDRTVLQVVLKLIGGRLQSRI